MTWNGFQRAATVILALLACVLAIQGQYERATFDVALAILWQLWAMDNHRREHA